MIIKVHYEGFTPWLYGSQISVFLGIQSGSAEISTIVYLIECRGTVTISADIEKAFDKIQLSMILKKT